jgi:hypothetical protein
MSDFCRPEREHSVVKFLTLLLGLVMTNAGSIPVCTPAANEKRRPSIPITIDGGTRKLCGVPL